MVGYFINFFAPTWHPEEELELEHVVFKRLIPSALLAQECWSFVLRVHKLSYF